MGCVVPTTRRTAWSVPAAATDARLHLHTSYRSTYIFANDWLSLLVVAVNDPNSWRITRRLPLDHFYVRQRAANLTLVIRLFTIKSNDLHHHGWPDTSRLTYCTWLAACCRASLPPLVAITQSSSPITASRLDVIIAHLWSSSSSTAFVTRLLHWMNEWMNEWMMFLLTCDKKTN